MNSWHIKTWSKCQWWINFLTNLGTFVRYEIDMRLNVEYPYTIITTSRNAVYMEDKDNYD